MTEFPEGWPVRRKSDGREGIADIAWMPENGGPQRVFVRSACQAAGTERSGDDFLSPVTGEEASAYESLRPVVAPDIERKAGRRHDGILPSFSSLGAYPLIYLTKGGEVLCADCATEQIDTGNDTNFDPVIDVDVYWEGAPLDCGDCGKQIASAYGDPWADENKN